MKTKLIKALKVAIHALENSTVSYDWHKQESCNCGVVAQAILGKSKDAISADTNAMFSSLKEGLNLDPTWRNAVQQYCSITGKPSRKIFKELFDAGLSPEDMTHLEFMDNPAILKRAKLEVEKVINVPIGEVKKKVPITVKVRAKGLAGLLGGTVDEVQYKEQIEKTFKKEKVIELEDNYFSSKKNLIKYLKAWVGILEEDSKPVTKEMSKQDLQEELLRAVSDDNFEKAVELRDKIAVMA